MANTILKKNYEVPKPQQSQNQQSRGNFFWKRGGKLERSGSTTPSPPSGPQRYGPEHGTKSNYRCRKGTVQEGWAML